MDDDRFLLTLEIDGRKYPLKVKRSDEGFFREAAKKINTKINQYRIEYGESPGIISQDFIAMTALQALVENHAIGDKNQTKPFEDKINSLITELDSYLRKYR